MSKVNSGLRGNVPKRNRLRESKCTSKQKDKHPPHEDPNRNGLKVRSHLGSLDAVTTAFERTPPSVDWALARVFALKSIETCSCTGCRSLLSSGFRRR